VPHGTGMSCVHTQPHSPEACREKARECVLRAETLADPKQKAAMLVYAEWWARLAEYGHTPCVLLAQADPQFQA
jgi:hypothetical protein